MIFSSKSGSSFRWLYLLPVIVFVTFLSANSARASGGLGSPLVSLEFGTTSSATAVDTSGHGNHGVIAGNPIWTTNKTSSAVSFNSTEGSADYMYIPNLDLSQTKTVTVSFWMQQLSQNGGSTLFELSPNSNNSSAAFAVYVNFCGQFNLAIHGNAGYNVKCYNDPGLNVTDTWHLYTFVFDNNKTSAADQLQFYIDGVLQSATEQPNAELNSNTFSKDTLYLIERSASNVFTKAVISDVRIFDRVLSAAEIEALQMPLAPVITINEPENASTTVGTPFSDPGATADDIFDGALTVTSSTDPVTVDFNATGTYAINYSATNSRGMTGNAVRTVKINEAPVIVVPPSDPVPPTTGGDDSSGALSNAPDPSIVVPETGGDDTSGAITGPSNIPNTNSSSNTTAVVGGGGGSFTTPAFNNGLILGASDATPRVLGASSSCTKYLTSTLGPSDANDKDEVLKLQAFLNEQLGANTVPMTGVFGPVTLGALMQFQNLHKNEILGPWINKGLNHNGLPTGIVGPTTLRFINNLVCPELQLPMPAIE